MGIWSYSKLCFLQSGLLRQIVVHHKKRLLRVYYASSSALLMEDYDFDCIAKVESDNNEVGEFQVPEKRFKFCRNPSLFPIVVRVFKSLNWCAARKISFHNAVKMYGFDHSIYAFRIIIHIFAMTGMQMEAHALLRDIVCYYKGVKNDVFELLPYLLDSPEHVHRSTSVFNVLIKVFASNLMVENAVDVFVEAKTIGIELSIMSCNFLLKCLLEANRGEFMRSLFEEMKNSGPSPNVYTYTIMMNFYCKGYYGRGADIEQATKLMEEMERDGINPSVVTYRTYICGICRVGHVESALDFIRDLRSGNQPINSFCYNAVIYGFCQKGEPYEASKVLEEMRSCGILPDVHSYSILIDGFCKRGDFVKVFHFIDEMKHNDMKPSIVTYTSLFDGLCKSGLADVSLNLFRNFCTSGYEFDLVAYSVLLKGLCLQGDLDSAMELFNEMINNGLIPTANSFNRLIHGFCKMGPLDKALELFNIMLQSGVLPTVFTFNVIIDGYCSAGHLEEALKLINEMHELGFFPNSYTYNGIIKRLCKQSSVEKAWELENPREQVPASFTLRSSEERVISVLGEVVCISALQSTEKHFLENLLGKTPSSFFRWFRKSKGIVSKDSSVVLHKVFEDDIVENARNLLESFNSSKESFNAMDLRQKNYWWTHPLQSKLEKNGGHEFSAWTSEYIPAYRLEIDANTLKDVKFEGWRESNGSRWQVLLTHSQMVGLADILDMYYEDVYTLPKKQLHSGMVANYNSLTKAKRNSSFLKVISSIIASGILLITISSISLFSFPYLGRGGKYLGKSRSPSSIIESTTIQSVDAEKLETFCVLVIQKIKDAFGWPGEIATETNIGAWIGEIPSCLKAPHQANSNSEDNSTSFVDVEKMDADIKSSVQDIAGYQVVLSTEGKIVGFQPTSRVGVNQWALNPLTKELYGGKKLSPGLIEPRLEIQLPNEIVVLELLMSVNPDSCFALARPIQ